MHMQVRVQIATVVLFAALGSCVVQIQIQISVSSARDFLFEMRQVLARNDADDFVFATHDYDVPQAHCAE